jgi:hypothetical protein
LVRQVLNPDVMDIARPDLLQSETQSEKEEINVS